MKRSVDENRAGTMRARDSIRTFIVALALVATGSFWPASAQPTSDAEIVLNASTQSIARRAAYERMVASQTAIDDPRVHAAAVSAYLTGTGRNEATLDAAQRAAERGLALLAARPAAERADYLLALARAAGSGLLSSEATSPRRARWADGLYTQAETLLREAGDADRLTSAYFAHADFLIENVRSLSNNRQVLFDREIMASALALVDAARVLKPGDEAMALRVDLFGFEHSVTYFVDGWSAYWERTTGFCFGMIERVAAGVSLPETPPQRWASILESCAGAFVADSRPARQARLSEKAALLITAMSSAAFVLDDERRARIRSSLASLQARGGRDIEARTILHEVLAEPDAFNTSASRQSLNQLITGSSVGIAYLELAALEFRSRNQTAGVLAFDRALGASEGASGAWAALPSDIDAIVAIATTPSGLNVTVLDRRGGVRATITDPDTTLSRLTTEAIAPEMPASMNLRALSTMRVGFLAEYFMQKSVLGPFSGVGMARVVRTMSERTGEFLGAPLSQALNRAGLNGGERIVIIAPAVVSAMPLSSAQNPATGRAFAADYVLSYAPSFEALFRAAGASRQILPRVLAALTPPANTQALAFGEREPEIVADAFSRVVAPDANADIAGPRAALRFLSRAPYWQISSHGVFPAEDWFAGDFSRTGIVLRNGVLTIADIDEYRAPGPVRLVVLSACESGAVAFMDDPLRVRSLPAALLHMGARGVVGAMWQVTDVSTALLMRRFWREHLQRGREPAEALHAAQRWLARARNDELIAYIEGEAAAGRLASDIAELFVGALAENQGEERPYADPYYWAGFVAYGL